VVRPVGAAAADAVECWLVNARDVKNVPGRPKTGRLDAAWLCKLAERGMLRPSFVPPPWQRELRDLCRYGRILIQERTREKQRAEKLLEDTQIKLSSVISDIFGKSGRDMLEALTGQFCDHHGWLLRMMLDRIDAITAQAEALTARIDEVLTPCARQVAQLDEIPAADWTGAQELIAEIGTDVTRFPTAGHLVSWARFAPWARQSAGKAKPGTTGKGSPWIAGALGEAVMGAARTKTFLGSRYHRLARRRGKQRAIVATGRSILVIACQLLSDPEASFADLGPDWHDRIAPLRRKRQLIAELERLSGKKVTLQEAAA
jgi:transposase